MVHLESAPASEKGDGSCEGERNCNRHGGWCVRHVAYRCEIEIENQIMSTGRSPYLGLVEAEIS